MSEIKIGVVAVILLSLVYIAASGPTGSPAERAAGDAWRASPEGIRITRLAAAEVYCTPIAERAVATGAIAERDRDQLWHRCVAERAP